MKPKVFEVIYRFTVTPSAPVPSILNWNTEPIDELIRCKDCKYNPKTSYTGCPMASISGRTEGDYCSWADRRGEE